MWRLDMFNNTLHHELTHLLAGSESLFKEGMRVVVFLYHEAGAKRSDVPASTGVLTLIVTNQQIVPKDTVSQFTVHPPSCEKWQV
jgi:hypothetical protein